MILSLSQCIASFVLMLHYCVRISIALYAEFINKSLQKHGEQVFLLAVCVYYANIGLPIFSFVESCTL